MVVHRRPSSSSSGSRGLPGKCAPARGPEPSTCLAYVCLLFGRPDFVGGRAAAAARWMPAAGCWVGVDKKGRQMSESTCGHGVTSKTPLLWSRTRVWAKLTTTAAYQDEATGCGLSASNLHGGCNARGPRPSRSKRRTKMCFRRFRPTKRLSLKLIAFSRYKIATGGIR